MTMIMKEIITTIIKRNDCNDDKKSNAQITTNTARKRTLNTASQIVS